MARSYCCLRRQTATRDRSRAAKADSLLADVSLNRSHFHQAIIERRGAAEVGQRLARHRVRVLATRREPAPPHRWGDDDAGPCALGDARGGKKAAAIVEDAHGVAGGDAARARIVGMDVQMRRLFLLDEYRQVSE